MITSEQLANTILEFRSLCLKQYSGDADLVDPTEREKRLGHVVEELKDFFLTHANQPVDHLCRIIETPRMLKTVLRHAERTWAHLHGEIDLDDVLVATTLRFATPSAFDFIVNHFRSIRALEGRGIGNDKKERLEELNAKWNLVTPTDWDKASARRLIGFLFPTWSDDTVATQRVPQGVAVANPTDYWLRFMEASLHPDEVRDQEVVQSIKNWNENEKEHFRGNTIAYALATHDNFSNKFEQVVPFFLDGKRLRSLASELFAFMQDKYGVKANRDVAPGFTPLWRCAVRKPIDAEAHERWILSEIIKYLPLTLRLANDLYYFWSANDQSDVGGGRDHRNLRTAVVNRARSLYEGNPSLFIRVLDPGFMYTSYHFAVLHGEPKQGGAGFVVEEWRWFMHLLIEASAIAPDKIIPQICVFVCKEELFPYHCEFNEAEAKKLFADEYEQLLKLLHREFDHSSFDERERQRLITVREAAMKLI
jgi:hypothetical protein